MPDVTAAREIFQLLDTLRLVNPAGMDDEGQLEAPEHPPVQCRTRELDDGQIAMTLLAGEASEADAPAAPDPLLELVLYPVMGSAEIRRLIYDGDCELDPFGPKGKLRPLVMRVARSYVRRWLGQLAADGYLFRSENHSDSSRTARVAS